MALQSLGGGLLRWPEFLFRSDSTGTGTIDADGEYLAAVIYNPVATTMRGFAAYCGTVTAAGDLDFTLETTADGFPTGTLIDAGATATVTVSATGTIKADFGANISIPVGVFAACIRRSSGTANVAFVDRVQANVMFPPNATINGTFYDDNISLAFAPFIGVPPAETYLRFPYAWPVQTNQGITGPGGAGQEKGASVMIPFKARCCGIAFRGRQSASPSSPALGLLYSSDGTTELARGEYLGPLGNTIRAHFVPFDTPVELTAGSTYYMALQAVDGSNLPQLWSYSILDGSAALCGISERLTRASAASAWSSDGTTTFSAFALVLDQLDDGVQVAPEYPGLGHPIVGVLAQPKLVGVLA